MFTSIQEYLAHHKASNDLGSSIYEHEVSRALNHAIDSHCLDRFLADGYKINTCTRVLYSSQSNWIDILVQLAKQQFSARLVVITYESDTNRHIGATEVYEAPRSLNSDIESLPFCAGCAIIFGYRVRKRTGNGTVKY